MKVFKVYEGRHVTVVHLQLSEQEFQTFRDCVSVTRQKVGMRRSRSASNVRDMSDYLEQFMQRSACY